MQLPIIQAAPLVERHAEAFRDLFENRRQYEHFKQYVTGLMVLDNKSLTNMTGCIVDSADKTNWSGFLSEAPWAEKEVNERWIAYLLAQTKAKRRRSAESVLVIDDTLCEHVGTLFEYIDHHYNHGEDRYPLAHNPVTSHYVSGVVRFPLDWRLYRRYEEVTEWERFVAQHFPDRSIPGKKKARAAFHKAVDGLLLQDPAFRSRHDQFQTKIDLAIELIHQAEALEWPFDTVVFDSWYLAEGLVGVLKTADLDWISLVKKNRNVETNSFVFKDGAGKVMPFASAHLHLKEWVPLIPANAYRRVVVKDSTYWCFTLTVRLPSLGKVRLVVSFDNPQLKGTYALLVTNRLDWSAHHILSLYLQRWPVETFYQDSKTFLGLDTYRMRSAEAIGKQWCLVFVAYSFLHLDCLAVSLTESKLPLKTIGQACRHQAQALLEALIVFACDQLQQGCTAAAVLNNLFAKQQRVPT
ncbi:MAG: IS701 family transposase [Aggregatilineales bacterium]